MAWTLLALPGIGIGAALVGFLVVFIIYLLIMGFILYLAGKVVVGRRVTFGEAIAVAAAATFLVTGAIILLAPFIGLFAYLIGVLIFLGLVKRYFRTGWLSAVGVGIMAIVVAIILIFVLGLLALGALLALPGLPKLPF
jgi:hypothetical protein